MTKEHGLHQGARPPRATPRFPGEFLLALRRDPLTLFTDLAARYGAVVELRLPFRSVYVLTDPDHVGEVLGVQGERFARGPAIERARVILGNGLLTSEGEVHRRQRKQMQPMFMRQALAASVPVMAIEADRHARQWRDGQAIDASKEMLALTLAGVVKTLFDVNIDDEAEDIGHALGVLFDMSNRLMLPFGPLLLKLPLPASRRFRRACAILDRALFPIIRSRRWLGVEAPHVTDQEARDQAMTLLLAGHETTACALTWTWFLLAHHPEIERRMHEELDRELGGRLPAADDLPRLVYTERIFAESMRLYPPVWSIGRRALADVHIGGYRIPAGSIVVLSPWVTHRDERYWPDPLRFDPDRFAPGARAERPREAYFPFGDGKRRCIGEHLAWLLGVVTLSTIARTWRLRCAPGCEISPLSYLFLLYPGFAPAGGRDRRDVRRGLPMQVAARDATRLSAPPSG